MKILDDATIRAQAQRRREALIAGQCATYTLGYSRHSSMSGIDNDGHLAIVCLCCGLGSVGSPLGANDIENRYCGFCHEWHSEWAEKKERRRL